MNRAADAVDTTRFANGVLALTVRPHCRTYTATTPKQNRKATSMKSRLIPGAFLTAAVSLLAFAQPAGAATTVTVQTAYGSKATPNGSAVLTRTGNTVTVAITLQSGSTFSGAVNDLQICASLTAFTSKVNPPACPLQPAPQFTETGSSATETVTLPNTFTGQTAYFQVHLNTIDNGVPNTTEANPVPGSDPLYGNVTVPSDAPGTTVPVGAVGGLGVAGLAATGLVVAQRRSRRGKSSAAA